MHFYLRTTGEPEPVVSAVRAAVAELDPGLPVVDLTTMTAQISSNLLQERLLTSLTGSFGGLAALLAAIGLYGVLAYNVARRASEIGIRMALGATSGQVRRLVVRDGSLIVLVGTGAGLALAAGVARLLQRVLYELTPWDPLVYGSAAAALEVVATVAAFVPARRATSIDPMVALRCE
jgi:ABC-type antimicrobial peptide transport system permease subunit